MQWKTGLVAVGVVVTFGASAAQLALTPEALCGLSSAVIVGEVTSIETRWAEGAEGGIERRADVAVLAQIAGQAPDSVQVVLPGGTIDGLRHWVEDVPDLVVDQRYVLFLAPEKSGALAVVGGAAGARFVKPSVSALGPTVAAVRAETGACLAPR